MKSQRIKNKFIELRAEGYSFNRIAKLLKTNKQTLLNWGKELDAEIQRAIKLKREEFIETFKLNREARLKQLATINNKLISEINKRDLSLIPTDKLLGLSLKYHQTISEVLAFPPHTTEQEAVINQRPEITLVFENDESLKRNSLDKVSNCN